jgi:hypothetical protein
MTRRCDALSERPPFRAFPGVQEVAGWLVSVQRKPEPPATMQSEAMRRSGANEPPATMQSEAMRRSGANEKAGTPL